MAITDLEKERLNAIDSRTREIGLGAIVQTAQNDIDTAEADIDALEGYQTDVATDVGLVHHVKITTGSGATGNTDKALPTGTWDVVDAWTVVGGTGTTSDTVQLLTDGGDAISNAIDISSASANDRLGASSINTTNGEGLVGGTTGLRATITDGGGSDVPACDVHVSLRKVA